MPRLAPHGFDPPLDEEAGEPWLLAEAVDAALHPREWSAGRPGGVQLFLVLSRGGALIGEGEPVRLAAPALAWLPGGHGRAMRFEAGARGYRLSASAGVVATALSAMPGAGAARRLLAKPATAPASSVGRYADELVQSFQVLAREAREPEEGSTAMAAAHLALLCLHASRLADAIGANGRVAPERAASIAQRFQRLLELHLRDGWSVRRYAEALGVTEDRLHAASMRRYRKTPGVLIRERLLREVCTQLRSSDLPVGQIAFALGFRDPGYFSRFCRKHLGLPPGRFRREATTLGAPSPGGSFAAWP